MASLTSLTGGMRGSPKPTHAPFRPSRGRGLFRPPTRRLLQRGLVPTPNKDRYCPDWFPFHLLLFFVLSVLLLAVCGVTLRATTATLSNAMRQEHVLRLFSLSYVPAKAAQKLAGQPSRVRTKLDWRQMLLAFPASFVRHAGESRRLVATPKCCFVGRRLTRPTTVVPFRFLSVG